MQKGKIVELNERNSGLIKRVGLKDSLFFHADAVEGVSFGELHMGDKVAFEVIESKKGPYAVHVSRA